MAAAGLDSIAAIVGYAVCSGISITSGSLVYSILSGPLQVLLLHTLFAALRNFLHPLHLLPAVLHKLCAFCLHHQTT